MPRFYRMRVLKISSFWLFSTVFRARMLPALLIRGRYFESSCDICLHFALVANRKSLVN